MAPTSDVTQALLAHSGGDRAALDRVLPLVYDAAGAPTRFRSRNVVLAAHPHACKEPALDDPRLALAQRLESRESFVEPENVAWPRLDETAEALEISPATVKRQWTAARAWLNRELSRE
jgi:hypothetical protein